MLTTSVLNYAGIATAYMLNINAANLYNHNTFFSGKDMKLYVSNLLKNYEDAKIYSGENLIIAKDATGAKSNRIENIVGSIESASDMNISTKVLENIGRTDIKYERVYRDILDNRTSSVVDDLKTIDISFDSGRYHNRTEANNVFALNVHNMLTDIGIETISEDDLKNGNNFNFLAIEGDIKNLSVTKSANIVSGKNLELHADDVLNKDALLSASKNINLNISNNLRNETTRENVTVQNYQYGFVKAFDHDRGWYRRHRVDEDKYYTTSNEYTPLDRSVTVTGSSLISANSITGTVGGNLINKSDISAENVEGGSIEAIIDAQHISTATEETRAELSEVTEVDSTVKESTDTSVKVPKDLEEEPLAETPQVYDPSKNNISLPNNAYGIFVTNPTPTGPLIESNPAYVNHNNFISSDYMLSRLGYDGTAQTRRLGDALYETQLVRDAIMSLTGQCFIGNAKDDKEQYTNLMNAGVNYAQEVGLTLGVAPTAKQLESLTEDLVWMEKKTVEGQEVLVPVVYLAKEYTAVKGANILANSMDLTVDGHVGNSGTIKTKEGMTLRAGTISNVKGNIEAGKTMDISTIGDIKNLSGTIKGRTVKLRSLEGNIKNQTLSEQKELKHRLGTESYTAVDTKATITSTKGLLSLDAKKSIENIGADLNSKGDIKLKAEDVTVKTIKDKREYAFNFGKDYVKGKSVKHIQSGIKAEGLVDINGKNSINLEAVNIEAKSTLLESDGKVNITAVVDSNYDESHAEANDAVEDSSVTDISLKQNVKGTNINTGTLTIKGKKGVSLESANIVATQSANIGSENGDVDFTAKSYTNAEHHESSNSSLGGLVSSKTVDSKSEILLANSSTKAKNSITIAGKNINLTATDLSSDGEVKLTADEHVNIMSGMESNSEEHIKEKRGLSLGLSGNLSDGLRVTIGEVDKDKAKTVNHTNVASNINSNSLVINSGKDTNVIASNITTNEMTVNARDFNVLSDNDVSTKNEEHSTQEIGVELKLNEEEASLFGGYWEEGKGTDSTVNQIVSSNIKVGTLTVNSTNTNVVGSNISGEEINIKSDNIRVLAANSSSDIDDYTKKIKAGVEVGVKQNLTQTIKSLENAKNAEGGGEVAAGLKAYDAVQNFASHPVEAGVNAIYEESRTNNNSKNEQIVASSITATKRLTLDAKNELEIAGSDVGSANELNVKAKEINIHSATANYSTNSESSQINASVGLYGTKMGQATVGVQQNEMETTGTTHRNSQLFAGGKATITSTGDTTLAGANIEAKDLELTVGGNLNMQSQQDTQSINGKSRGGSVSGGVQGITGLSVNGGKTKGEKKWVNQVTSINGSGSVKINVKGTTTLAGATISNVDKDGKEQNNLELTTKNLVATDIKDVDTYDSTTVSVGVGTGKNSPSLNSIGYGANTKDKEQITRATIGSGTIKTQNTTGTVNRDLSNIQEVTKDESDNMELYASNHTLDLVSNPTGAVKDLGDTLEDVGLVSHVEIQENLPSATKGKDGEGDFLDNTIGALLDSVGSTGITPSVANDGGYVTGIATLLFGDNRNRLVFEGKDKLLAMGIDEKDIVKTEMKNSNGDVLRIVYATDPDKKVIIGGTPNPDDPLDGYKIYVSEESIKQANVNHVFTNGMNNSPTEALANQQDQQGNPEAALLNYNQTHGILADLLLEVGAEKAFVMADDIPGIRPIGEFVTGSARQTGETITTLSRINNGDLHITAHSQGTDQTYLGMQYNRDALRDDVEGNKNANFTVQFSGAPVSSVASQELVRSIYGDRNEYFNENHANIFRSQANPGDPVAMLGGNTAGVNENHTFFTGDYWSEIGYAITSGVPGFGRGKWNGTDTHQSSPHSGYPCLIGCGEATTNAPIDSYSFPSVENPERSRPLGDFHDDINVRTDFPKPPIRTVSSNEDRINIGQNIVVTQTVEERPSTKEPVSSLRNVANPVESNPPPKEPTVTHQGELMQNLIDKVNALKENREHNRSK